MEPWLETKTVVTWIIVTILGMAILTITIVRLFTISFKKQIKAQKEQARLQLSYQNKLIETSIAVQERERDRIAADLHDSLIGKLTVLRLKTQLKFNPEEVDSALEDCITDARRISHDLSPPMLEFINLADIVDNTIENWKEQFEITAYKNIKPVDIDNTDFKLQLTRILQEIMNNIYKHAQATKVDLNVRINTNSISIIIRDNGKGFDVKTASKGLGLRNIELRVMYIKGSYKIKSSSKGTSSILFFNLKQLA